HPHISHNTEYSQHPKWIRDFQEDHPNEPKSVSPFLVAASSGLSEEALTGEASEAAPSDVDGWRCHVG
ncbi:hypothetical protein, partial [Streptomyces sp. NPDC014685]|uniref:hypothetical protein n=1 Tax=Streptomyces sp. NPDC014685 TaxID=3364881 RepID=UPI0036F8CF73